MNRQVMVLGALLSCFLLVFQCRGQPTYSHGWNIGKRSSNLLAGTDCIAHAHQSAALCQMLMNEIKQLTTCEVRLLNHKARDVPSTPEEIFRPPATVEDDQ